MAAAFSRVPFDQAVLVQGLVWDYNGKAADPGSPAEAGLHLKEDERP